ncbi:MAG TPA: aminoglycoside phosphotransferase family protein [Anaerolineales bacterium]|nr:aminoglycoside phosphotransferase family protein [Anaerolineales bacterium]
MSKNLGNPISSGRTAEIYNWDQEHVLKLFHSWVTLDSIENEARMACTIYKRGLPVPKVGGIVRLEDRTGLIYQRVYGDSMYKAAQHRPWNIIRYLRRSAELHTEIHSHSISAGLPSQRQILERQIRQAVGLPLQLRAKALEALNSMPDGNQLCHGDFWGGNILMSPRGEVIIDWNRACYGNPLADLARTTNGLMAFLKTTQVRRAFLSYGKSRVSQVKNSLFRLVVKMTYPVYVQRYFQLRPGGEKEYRRWLPVVAAARLVDEIPELDGMLIEQVEKYL